MKTIKMQIESVIRLILESKGLFHLVKDLHDDEVIFYSGAYSITEETINLLAIDIETMTGLTCSTGIHPNKARYIVYS